jgi:hypothetical protein
MKFLICGLLLSAACAVPSSAQTSEVKEKPPMFTYVANWQIPRSHWADMEKSNSANSPILEKALANGTIVGYGNDENLVHQPDGETHDNWFSAMSMAGLINVLDQFYSAPNLTSDVLASSTKHWDVIFVSHYYNWHPGSYKGAYTHVGAYKLKTDAPDDAVDTLSKNLIVPLLEKMLSDGTILEYEVDTMAIHTEAPGTFWISYVAPKPEGLDKVLAAIADRAKTQPLNGSAFGSMTDSNGHRDELIKGDGTYK